MSLMPQVGPASQPCPNCEQLATLGVQWVDSQAQLAGGDGQPIMRAIEKYTLCLWCLRREHSVIDPENREQWKVVETREAPQGDLNESQ